MYKIGWIGLLLWFAAASLQGQENYGLIRGSVMKGDGEPLIGVSILVEPGNKGVVADQEGRYELALPPGDYQLTFSALGYRNQSLSIRLKGQQVRNLQTTLQEEAQVLQNIVVRAESAASILAKNPIAISTLDGKALRQQAIGAKDLLKRSTGVLVRQQGGLGSDLQLNLNGLSGRAVRVYYDGIPLEFYGGGVRLNNLPVNLIDRIEVYKGVMPINIGTDALGGGINIVPRRASGDYLEASYEAGSFHTQRATVLARKQLRENISIGLNGFFNYSQNDYRMEDIPNQSIRVFENTFGQMDTTVVENRIDARRFNDRHSSAQIEANLGIRNQSWADRLTYGLVYTQRKEQFQHGRRVTKRPAGEAFTDNRSFLQRLNYRQTLGEKWNLRYFGSLSLARESVNDSTTRVYDWRGAVLPIPNRRGSEILPRPSLRKGEQLNTTHRLTASWQMNNRHTATASNFWAYSRIAGNDPAGHRLTIGGEPVDPNTIPSRFQRNIFGAEIQSKWLADQRLSSILFYKNYFYRARSIDITQETGNVVPLRNNADVNHGLGLALKFQFGENFFIRSSLERTIRIPDEPEIYGNFLFILPNYNLRPERSNNLNLGGRLSKDIDNHRAFSIDLNGFLRAQRDLIRLEPIGGGEQARYINETEVSAAGLELAARVEPLRHLEASLNFTFQHIALSASDRIQNDAFIGVQVPNIPDWFLNASLSYECSDLFLDNDRLQLFWNYFYVNQFSVTYVINEASANPDNLVPTQHQHRTGLTYRPDDARLSLSFQVDNLLNDTLYDNFRVPKPGRRYAVKLNYLFIKP